jgi:hypothetical protein
MEMVPKITDLPALPLAKMVNPILVPDIDKLTGMINHVVFKNLVPMRVHQQISKYSYKKDQYVKQLCDKLREATALAHTYSSLI